MHKAIDSLLKTRTWALQLVEGLSDKALNTIPEGFNNNIIWNLAHLVAAEQGVCYVRSGIEPVLQMDFVKRYTRGTKPESPVSAEEIAEIKAMLLSTPARLDADLAAGRFKAYKAWATPYGVELQTIEDALQFLGFHEGMHCGYIMALKRVVEVEQPASLTMS
jgi:hypothetical protein